MKILYYDCRSGISGDMNLAAMLHLGVDPARLRTELAKLGLEAEYELRIAAAAKNGITGIRVDVDLLDAGHDHEAGHHGHAHEHDHGHEHGHGHGHGQQAHHHRRLSDIEALLAGSALDERVRRTSRDIFRRLARAEATVHGVSVEDVHFHEVGATDALVDIVGAAVCRHVLDVDAVWASPVELGGGFARCAHGLIPVPAPATVELLRGVPTTRGAVAAETTTPTGAAILTSLVDTFTAAPAMVMDRTGYGIGHRDLDIPNLLRVHLGTATASPGGAGSGPARLLQCNIDDMTAEALGAALELLMDAGAMDVHLTPIVMKKSRPATCLSLLCATADEARFTELVFRHTTTLGIKRLPVDKVALDTAFETLDTPLGPVTMKNALMGGAVLRSKPEFEDCRRLAKTHGLPLAAVYEAIAASRKCP
ncbi:MAG: nickel pincer cofactor biosynthesis protein LarC [Solidesulfovibrio sp.]|uniref:nickel pincer cofactor biosynthesis protein LarC n=1 Tax=Solidesulfovibrio sp. TaxID=2910990 RepID=UPI003158B906